MRERYTFIDYIICIHIIHLKFISPQSELKLGAQGAGLRKRSKACEQNWRFLSVLLHVCCFFFDIYNFFSDIIYPSTGQENETVTRLVVNNMLLDRLPIAMFSGLKVYFNFQTFLLFITIQVLLAQDNNISDLSSIQGILEGSCPEVSIPWIERYSEQCACSLLYLASCVRSAKQQIDVAWANGWLGQSSHEITGWSSPAHFFSCLLPKALGISGNPWVSKTKAKGNRGPRIHLLSLLPSLRWAVDNCVCMYTAHTFLMGKVASNKG